MVMSARRGLVFSVICFVFVIIRTHLPPPGLAGLSRAEIGGVPDAARVRAVRAAASGQYGGRTSVAARRMALMGLGRSGVAARGFRWVPDVAAAGTRVFGRGWAAGVPTLRVLAGGAGGGGRVPARQAAWRAMRLSICDWIIASRVPRARAFALARPKAARRVVNNPVNVAAR